MSINKTFSILLLSLSFFSLSNCGNVKNGSKALAFQKNPPFVIEKVTAQKTIAGTKEGGTSSRLIVPVSQAKEGVVFKDLYFREQVVEAKYNHAIKSQYIGFFTTVKKDFIMDSDPVQEAKNTPRAPFPFTLNDGEAVISYEYQNKLAYYKISSIEELAPIALPSQNPNLNNGLKNKL